MDVQFVIAGDTSEPSNSLRMEADDASMLLRWLGLAGQTFAYIAAPDLKARCRRRLWPIPRNTDRATSTRPEGFLRDHTAALLRVIDRAGDSDFVLLG